MLKFKFLIPCAFLFFGLFLFIHPMLFNSDMMPGDLGDARFISYVLEHGNLWFHRVWPHLEFWSAPQYFPAKDSLAQSDVLLGGMMLYIPIRFFVSNPLDALQVYFALINILNFVVFYFFSRKIFKLEVSYSSIAAFFFAFCLPRYPQICHIQLFLQFYMILSLFCFCLINSSNSKRKNALCFTLGCFVYVLLAYSAFYWAWFSAFGVCIGFCVMLIFKDTRKKLFNYFKNFNAYFFIPVLISLGFLGLLFYKYINNGLNLDVKYYSSFYNIFISQSALDMKIFAVGATENPENQIGIGIIATVIFLVAVFRSKYSKQILLFLAIVFLTFTNTHILKWLTDNFIAMKAIRATSRFVFLLVPIYSIFIAFFFKSLKKDVLFCVLLALLVFEQVPCVNQYRWTKTMHYERLERLHFPESCKVIGIAPLISDSHKVTEYLMDSIHYAMSNHIYSADSYWGTYQLPPRECILIVK